LPPATSETFAEMSYDVTHFENALAWLQLQEI